MWAGVPHLSSELRNHPGSEGLHATRIAASAKDVVVQWVTAPALRLGRQQEPAILASVARNVEAPVQCNHPHSLFFSRLGHDRLGAHAAAGCKFFVEVVDAMDPTRSIYGKGNAIKAFAAHDALEARRVVGLARGSQDPVQNRLLTHATLLQRVQVVIFTVWLPIHGKEGLPPEFFHADMAGEALDVVDLVHGSASTALSQHLFAAFVTHAEEVRVPRVLHALDEQVGEVVHLGLLAAASAAVAGRLGCAASRVVGRVQRGARAAVARHLARGTWHNGLVDGARVVRAQRRSSPLSRRSTPAAALGESTGLGARDSDKIN